MKKFTKIELEIINGLLDMADNSNYFEDYKPKGCKSLEDVFSKISSIRMKLDNFQSSPSSIKDTDVVHEFGRKCFYGGREVKTYDEKGRPIFKRPTYNGYLRELDGSEENN